MVILRKKCRDEFTFLSFVIFNSFCGNDKFLLLLKIVLRNLDSVRNPKQVRPLELPHIVYEITNWTV